jgi:hypothetical protein
MDYPTYSFQEHQSLTQFNAPTHFASPAYLSRVPSDEHLDIPDEEVLINNTGYDLLQAQSQTPLSTVPILLKERNDSIPSDTQYAKAGI